MYKTICFDTDNPIFKINFNHKYNKSRPVKLAISTINKLYNDGYVIKIYTGRYMGRTNENDILVKIYFSICLYKCFS